MGKGDALIIDLRKFLPGWDFVCFNLDGLLGGIITNFSQSISLINCYSVYTRLVAEVMCKVSNIMF